MKIPFTKMHGQGNDFVMLNGIAHPVLRTLSAAQIRAIAHRQFGIGCDQVLLVEPPARPDADFRYRIFNASGDEVEHCGNGARCFPVFVRDEGLTTKRALAVETVNNLIRPTVAEDGSVTVDMGPPRFHLAEIPFVADAEAMDYALDVGGEAVTIAALSMGNPHAVLRVDDVGQAPVATRGPAIELHPRFPRRVNVGFMQVLSPARVRLRVWERGAGETLACGTGACAAVVAGIRWGILDETVAVETRGGELSVTWRGRSTQAAPVLMRGAATIVYRGEIDLDSLPTL